MRSPSLVPLTRPRSYHSLALARTLHSPSLIPLARPGSYHSLAHALSYRCLHRPAHFPRPARQRWANGTAPCRAHGSRRRMQNLARPWLRPRCGPGVDRRSARLAVKDVSVLSRCGLLRLSLLLFYSIPILAPPQDIATTVGIQFSMPWWSTCQLSLARRSTRFLSLTARRASSATTSASWSQAPLPTYGATWPGAFRNPPFNLPRFPVTFPLSLLSSLPSPRPEDHSYISSLLS